MELLTLDTEVIGSELYLALGLNESSKGVTETPRVLSLLSTFLERAVQNNEKLLETTEKKETVTVFHGSRAPSLSIRQYIDRIFKYSGCSPSCFVLAHIYIDRYLQQPDARLTSLNVHRLLITSVVVAAKFIDDAFFNNTYFARVGGVSTIEMNKLELKFLFSLDFRLQVNVTTFGRYCIRLEEEAKGGECPHLERPIQVCGWPNKEDSKSQPTIQRYSCGAV